MIIGDDEEKPFAVIEENNLLQSFEEGVTEMDSAFDKRGYVVARINRVAELASRIIMFKPIKDKKGETFWEVVFGGGNKKPRIVRRGSLNVFTTE